jgi:hypothetical protein
MRVTDVSVTIEAVGGLRRVCPEHAILAWRSVPIREGSVFEVRNAEWGIQGEPRVAVQEVSPLLI